MKRREFIAGIGGAATSSFLWQLAARAQQAQKQHRIAFVHSGIPADQLTETAGPFWVRRFYQTLRGLGHTEGGNLVVERYSAEGSSERFAALAAAVVNGKPDVIVSNQNALVKAFVAATATIPIVGIVGDPIAGGLVANLAHPGGNLTGVSINAGVEMYGKRLQILKEAMPSVAKVVSLRSNAWDDTTAGLYREAGQRLGITLTASFLAYVDEAQIRRTFADLAQQRLDAAIIEESGSFLAFRALIIELAGKYRLPVVYSFRDYVEQGGLMAYAPDLGELAERLANDVHQILNGAKPGDIPIFQPTKFQLIINLKAAKALGLDLSPTLIARADEVIE
jgi:putative ABC transport system substrate-binding protein